MAHIVSLRSLIGRYAGTFNIPAYQRRYVWGQWRPGERDSAAYLVDCLIAAYRRGQPVFLQGLTVTPSGDLVDGQQRVTCLCLLLYRCLGAFPFTISYSCRAAADAWFASDGACGCVAAPADDPDQDVFFFRKTLATAEAALAACGLNRRQFADFVLDNVSFLLVEVESDADAVAMFAMMNGTKSPMDAADVIKADLIRLATDERQPDATDWELNVLSARYAAEWNEWTHWWNSAEVRDYYSDCGYTGIDLLIALCLHRSGQQDTGQEFPPLTYEVFRRHIQASGEKDYHAAKHFFDRLRRTQRRFREAYGDAAIYNRIRAVLLLQKRAHRFTFLHSLFVDTEITPADIDRYYRLSFLGMDIDEIRSADTDPGSVEERFEILYATLSMPDVYHGDAKRDVFNLLLRLNIDEDIKLGRRFDFTVWSNRSLEHIYSKSKVWHVDSAGRICDGNDNDLRMPRRRLQAERTFIPRESIVDDAGVHLTEHCIGNLVLLYGQNNAEFGNASFEQKKQMFLSPGSSAVFRSRNLLHSVCVFARDSWNASSIAENYNVTLKNLKQYYGIK